MMRNLSSLFAPRSIALFGGGWAANVIAQLQKTGFTGDIWPVHPTRDQIGGITCLRSIDDLPAAPDASFVAVSRDKSIEVVNHLSGMGAGGAVCFASGFRESGPEGNDLQARLVEAAGDMPVLGPNCYGFLNYLDNAIVWPDQHGGLSVENGVAILAQSSNIAINMTMQRRNLPLAMLATIGNQAQTGYADIASSMLADERITAIGLYLEGLGDIRALEALAQAARRKGVPLVALKTGKSEKSRASGLTHTASLTGAAAASSALFERLGIVETDNVETFLETLKLLHSIGPLPGNRIASVSCSGGEAGLMADMGVESEIHFADFSDAAALLLRDQLGPLVSISNPFDYHTFIWGDVPAMTQTFATVMADGFDLTVFVLDLPRAGRCDPSGHDCAVEAIIAAKQQTAATVAVLSLLPENIEEETAARFAKAGVATLNGMASGLAAIGAAIRLGRLQAHTSSEPVALGNVLGTPILFNEIQAKQALAGFGLAIPRAVTAETPEDLAFAARSLSYPLALKGLGIAHKSEAGAVKIGIADEPELLKAAAKLTAPQGYLAEEMISGVIAELIVGVVRDETGLLLMTIGAGGVLAELTDDTIHLLLPASREETAQALSRLKVSKLLAGWRGAPRADMEPVVDAVAAIARYATDHAADLAELDVNPLMVCADKAVAADALIVHMARTNGGLAEDEGQETGGVEA